MKHSDIIKHFESLIAKEKYQLEQFRKIGQLTPSAVRRECNILDAGLQIIKGRAKQNQLDFFTDNDQNLFV